MITFEGPPLECRVGDIVHECGLNIFGEPQEIYWVITRIHDSKHRYKAYYAYNLSDPRHTVGPLIFRNSGKYKNNIIRWAND